ncbi:TPA: hypothetical protein I7715_21175 [Vibrio vulnificus]|nr:hypothetical protein [Vibrio vulnificus]
MEIQNLNCFKALFTSGRDMPRIFFFLHYLNVVTFFPLLLFAFLPWPDATYSLNGRSLSYSEFWLTGMAPAMMLFMALVVFLCFAVALRKSWSRLGVFLFWSAPIALITFHSLMSTIIGLVFIGLWGVYVFKNNKLDLYYRV